MTADPMPLATRRILLTRSETRAAALRARLERLGARVDAQATVAVERIVGASLPAGASHDWWIFTSVNGVCFFYQWLATLDSPPIARRIAAVGTSTAAELKRRGVPSVVVATEAGAAGLGRELAEQVQSGERVLIVRPEVSRPELAAALAASGAQVDSIPFYRNVPADGVERVAAALIRGDYELILFSSPSSLQHLLDHGGAALHAALDQARLIAIGPTTASAIAAAGLRVAATASAPDVEGIERAIVGVATA